MLTIVVIVMSVLLVLSLLCWLCSPTWRKKIEEPKYRFLQMKQPGVEQKNSKE
ncbi:hypothetical protein [Pragia fontium]|uniref:Uncharacterized protein n=2 Tax=Pragia fontium TaxID=82985 RepID=A0AAJ4WAA4_9GAMM|nr:hypothetical protein [Pragia fontium]GKX62704.1 hypothetical protein SOASR032_12730 [Pragia fontium]SFC75649.1 hypothetical protein SAMN02745723_10442 [Pragia fontium DSM 5563 = ATCC 49100]SUB82787.1 Uncharacterised protein [Pragia fontium]VEJ55686.1 Uncharacterised protein [Pragia fontium]